MRKEECSSRDLKTTDWAGPSPAPIATFKFLMSNNIEYETNTPHSCQLLSVVKIRCSSTTNFNVRPIMMLLIQKNN